MSLIGMTLCMLLVVLEWVWVNKLVSVLLFVLLCVERVCNPPWFDTFQICLRNATTHF